MEEAGTWLSDVIEGLHSLNGQAHYIDIYRAVEKVRRKSGATWPDSAEAIIRRVLEEQSSDTQSFKGKDLFYSAQGLGKGVWGLRTIKPEFQVGELYNRQKDIHDRFGGSRQSGISPCKRYPYVFIFTGSAGAQYGYGSDGWDNEGLFNYTGEGQVGDMQFTDGNKAIRDHIQEGRDLLMFQSGRKGEAYRFLGQFVCVGYEAADIPDRNNDVRKGIVFKLKNVEEEADLADETSAALVQNETLGALRQKAYAAASSTKQVTSFAGKRGYYERNRDIKAYVLLRANGICECCGKPAPFLRKNGTPYLEPHHIFKVSDKGEDHPRMIAGITPNCHREIHYGKNGEEIDKKLAVIISEKEKQIEINAAGGDG